MLNIVTVNTRTREAVFRICTDQEMFWGGRSFIAHYMSRAVDPLCDPLGRKNPLIIASGLLGDTPLTTAGRISIGGKSPITGGIKESNVGGAAGKIMARMGMRAVVLEDAPEKARADIVLIRRDRVEIIDAPELKGRETVETFRFLRRRFGDNAGFFCIGPAGENKMASALIATTDHTGVQLRTAGRGGLGAVMGAKGIKAVIFDDTGSSPPRAVDAEALKGACRELTKIIREDPKTENRHNYGTPAVLSVCNGLGILPTRNFSSGSFENADEISGETIAGLIEERSGEGKKGLPCVKGCIIACSNIFPDSSGKNIVASLQYENIALLGSNCGIGDIDEIAALNDLCNRMGVDAIEAGASLGVAMEAGIVSFGDAEGAKSLLRQIGEGTPMGRIIGSGVVTTGRVLGIRRVPAVKGQAMPAYDPRSLKGIGVTYAMSPMGADHTAGNALETARAIDPLGRDGQVESSYRLQVRGAVLDSLGVCLFIRPAFVKDPSLAARLLNARYGWDWAYRDVQSMSIDCLQAERDFNKTAGVSDTGCDVPEFMRNEPLPPHNTVFDISREEMNKIWKTKLPEDVF